MRPSITAAAAAILCAAGGHASAAASEQAIYTFKDGADGGFPHAGLIAGPKGAFYGTASSGGTDHAGVVFRLVRPPAGHTAWTEAPLYTFTGGNDGGTPYAGLLMDGTGALYGTTINGGTGGQGVAFKLTPPTAGHHVWTESVLWNFTGGNDGGAPWSTLIEDANGNLYGTTTTGGTGVVGTVFELSPPAAGQSAWTETLLYNFTGNADGGEPFGNVMFDARGRLYGTSAGYGKFNYGTVYQLQQKNKAWSFHLLHAFHGGLDGEVPRDGMLIDQAGALYGTTAGFDNSRGTVFKLIPPGNGLTHWTQQVLHRFGGQGFDGNGPWQNVSMDATGALYGTTLGVGASAYGEVFKLAPPPAGSTHWKETVLHVFQNNAGSQFPYSRVLIGAGGELFGTTYGSAGQSGFYPGNVWEITQ